METTFSFEDELTDSKNGIEKNQILQKYGYVPAKLTEIEKVMIEWENGAEWITDEQLTSEFELGERMVS
jgi:hypothetical protein